MPLTIISEKTGPLQVLTYLVACPDSKEALLIDPGGPASALFARLGREGWRLRWIVNTHGHWDHISGNEAARALGGRLVMHCLDVEFFSQPHIQAEIVARGVPPLGRVDLAVEDGDRLSLGDGEALIIHTPGHTPGSICLYFPGHLFTGDTLFVGAAGRTDLAESSLAALLRSLEEKIMPLPDDTRIWPGHDYGDTPASTLAQEKATNPFLTDFF